MTSTRARRLPRPAVLAKDPRPLLSRASEGLALLAVAGRTRQAECSDALAELLALPAGRCRSLGAMLELLRERMAEPAAFQALPGAGETALLRLADGRRLTVRGAVLRGDPAGRTWLFEPHAADAPPAPAGRRTDDLPADVADVRRREQELQRANRALADHARQLRQLCVNIPGVVLQLETGPGSPGTIRFISDRAAEFFGIEAAELQREPMRLLDCVDPRDRRRVIRGTILSRAGSRPWGADFRVIHAGTGAVTWMRGGFAPTPAGDGTLWDGVLVDVTALKQREADLSVATAEAQATSRLKTDFLAHMSHELRTPLNAILGFSEVMAEEMFGPLGETCYRDYARDIHYSGKHLLGIINGILDMAKIEAGRMELDESVATVDEVLQGCVPMLGERLALHRVDLVLDLDATLPPLRMDVVRMRQILLNLLSNAAKFTDPGGHVTVTGRHTAEGGVSIAVADDGIGMDPCEIATALEPFGQAARSRSRNHDGTGLGLPLAFRLIELHGGRLEIASTPGEGTTIRVTLPASRVVAQRG